MRQPRGGNKITLGIILLGPVIAGWGLTSYLHKWKVIPSQDWKWTLGVILVCYVAELAIGGMWRR